MRSGAAVLERTMTEDVRAVLEAIAFGDDGRVTPSDRLRALQHLSRMEPGQQPDGSYSSELAALEGEELDRHLDALLAEQIAADVLGEGTQWPTLAHLVQTEVERRADSLAQERQLDQVEVEIERRVEERMSQLATSAPVDVGIVEPAVAQDRTPPGVMAGFSSRGSRHGSASAFRKRTRVA
jgi:hypothetical protein